VRTITSGCAVTFGGLTPDNLPFRVYITPGYEGASHSSCDDTGLYCDAFDANDGVLMRYLVVAEADEVFMDSQDRGWMCGASNGEGLSRVLAADAYPPGMAGFFSAATDSPTRTRRWPTHSAT
jgi:hypothetical protein